jgi:CBS domain-containing protein
MKNSCPFCGFENPRWPTIAASAFIPSCRGTSRPSAAKGDAFQDALLKEPISELLTGLDLLVCSPDDTLEKIVKIFQKDKKGCVLVYKNKKMVGILSNRDLVLRTTGPKLDLKKIKVEEVMTRDPGFLHPEDPIAFAINKMAMGGYRHIPILRPDGTPVSILLIRDVLRYLSASKKNY